MPLLVDVVDEAITEPVRAGQEGDSEFDLLGVRARARFGVGGLFDWGQNGPSIFGLSRRFIDAINATPIGLQRSRSIET